MTCRPLGSPARSVRQGVGARQHVELQVVDRL
jgi:hypothetical protein